MDLFGLMQPDSAADFESHIQELEFLSSQGFPINPDTVTANSVAEIWAIQESLYAQRDKLKYQIDGLVVKLNDNQLTKTLGVVGKTPRSWCAVKFAADEKTTRILGIRWQVGRSGKVTPVAELEPLELAGTTVRRASLHNAKEVESYKLRLKDTLVVRKAGDIIPEVVAVLDHLRPADGLLIKLPGQCPECNTELEYTATGVDLICPNKATCPAQIVGRLSYFCQRNIANIVGLSEKQLELFVDTLGITDIPDLYRLPFDQIKDFPGFGEKSINKLKSSIEQAKEIESSKFLAGLGIQGVGVEVARLILNNLPTEK